MNAFDTPVLLWFNSLQGLGHAFDVTVAFLTDYAPVVFGLLFAAYYFFTRTEKGRMRRTVLLAGISGVVALVVAVALASLIYRARPFVALPDQVRLLIPHPPDSSFPSDHGTGSAAFAVGMWRAPGRSARWLFSVLALLVGVSRLIAGVHWPTDILLSFLLGGAVVPLVFALERPLKPVLDWVIRWF